MSARSVITDHFHSPAKMYFSRTRAWCTSALRDLVYCGAVFLWSIVAFTIVVTGVSVTASLIVFGDRGLRLDRLRVRRTLDDSGRSVAGGMAAGRADRRRLPAPRCPRVPAAAQDGHVGRADVEGSRVARADVDRRVHVGARRDHGRRDRSRLRLNADLVLGESQTPTATTPLPTWASSPPTRWQRRSPRRGSASCSPLSHWRSHEDVPPYTPGSLHACCVRRPARDPQESTTNKTAQIRVTQPSWLTATSPSKKG